LPRQLADELERLSGADLNRLTVRDTLSMMFSLLGEAERKAFLAQVSDDKGNGS
jgi:hypothetical protein